VNQEIDLGAKSTHDLLRVYAAVLQQLFDRRVIRTRNAPAGDLSETIVAAAYGGSLALINSQKSWDVLAADGRRLQVKSRVISKDARKRQIDFSTFRSLDFDAVVVVVFALESYDVIGGFEVPTAEIAGRARDDPYVGGRQWSRSFADFQSLPGVVDVTERLHSALLSLP
jgi:hypothetical protein